VSDGLLYLFTTASGFIAIALLGHLVMKISDPAHIDVGTAALIVFLAIYGVLGITAQLPHLMQGGKLLPTGFGGK